MLSFLGAPSTEAVRYQLTLRSESGALLRGFTGTVTGGEGLRTVTVRWDGRDSSGRVVPAGHYSLQLSSQAGGLTDEQEHTIQVGTVSTPRLASFAGLPVGTTAEALAPAAGGLPYTVYLGTLHSQTNHSDGGVPVSSCDGAEVPQRGALGPSAAYEMARAQAGLDFLLTTDHNHMFDGSTGVNSAADSAAANRLFASGVSDAIAYSRSHPGFVAAYGSEWGVISSGGHIGLVNPPALINWEHNGKGELIGSLEVAKNDYAALYELMKQKGVMGQFNHPRTGQFGIGGSAFAYDGNGDAVVVLAEVANSSSFSKNTTESETSVPSFEAGWKRLLEAGYHVAPSSDQDNHCANWGLALHNRTGILVPTGTPLTYGSLLSALRVHELTTQAPFETWIAIGTRARTPKLEGLPLRVVHMAKAPLTAGVDHRKIDGVRVAVFDLEKTVVDCFRFRNKIGLDVALEAIREYLRRPQRNLDRLMHYATIDRVAKAIRPYLEAMV